MLSQNPKIKKYLDSEGNFSTTKSDIVREAYKDSRVYKQGPISRFINTIFKIKKKY